MRPWWFIGATLALAAVSSVVESGGEPPARGSDGYHILEGDIHAHSIFAGALPTPVDLVLLARRQGLDFIAVVEHNSFFGARLSEWVAGWLTPGLVVIPSEEITTKNYHALAIGIRETIDPRLPLVKVAEETHRQGGVLVAAHPVRRFWDHFFPMVHKGLLDGVEVMHPSRVLRRDGDHAWRGIDMEQFWERAKVESPRVLAPLGGSDYHGLLALGYCRSIVFARARTSEAIVEAIREGRTLAVGPDGALEGSAEWIKRLSAAGHKPHPSRHSYATATPAGQALAWGVLLLLVAGLVFRRSVSG